VGSDPAQGWTSRLIVRKGQVANGLAAEHAPFTARRSSRSVDSLWTPVNVALLAPCILYLVFFAIYPLFYSLRLSFTDLTEAGGTEKWVGLQNYHDLLADPLFWNAAGNSGFFVTVSVAIEIVLGVALALFFNLRLRGSTIVRGLLVLPMLITPIIVGVMWRALLNPEWGLINWAIDGLGFEAPNWLGSTGTAVWAVVIVEVWQWTPFVFIIVFARLQALPQEVFEAAQVDGAGPFATLRHLTLPLLKPAIIFAAVFRAVDAFRSFDLIYGLSFGGPARATTTLSFLAFQNGFQFQNYGYAAAVSYVMLLILVIGTTLLFRYVALRPGQTR
jgi:multiple sugar transport system permease protein